MKIEEAPLKGILIITPDIFRDERGYFFEAYNLQKYTTIPAFVQDNESISKKGVFRGLHSQIPPFAHGKLARVISGKALDVVVDIRYNSPTFGKYPAVELSEENKKQLYAPPGFAHGFLALSEGVIFEFKTTRNYNKEHERGILWNDPDLDIDWGNTQTITVSDKDRMNKSFKELIKELKQIKLKDWNIRA